MKRKRIFAFLAVAALGLGGLLFYLYGGHSTPAGQPPLTELKPETFTNLENAFNAAAGNVRVLLLLSPT